MIELEIDPRPVLLRGDNTVNDDEESVSLVATIVHSPADPFALPEATILAGVPFLADIRLN